MASLKSLTDDDLRKKLKQHGITSPVTASTRNILIKKLNHAIANQKTVSTPNNTLIKTPGKSNRPNQLHTFSSDEDEDNNKDDASSHYCPSSGRTNRLSRSKRDSVHRGGSGVETPVSDRNGATNFSGRKRSSSTTTKFEGRDYHHRVSLRSRLVDGGDDGDNNTRPNSAKESYTSVNSFYSDVSTPRRTRVSLGTCYPVSARSGISPRAKTPHEDYDTGSDSDVAESEDAVDLSTSTRSSAASGMCNSNDRENHILSNNSLKGDSVRNRKARQSYMENGRRHEDECRPSEDHEKSFGVAESVVSQTVPGSHEPIRVANGRHHSETNSLIEPSPGDESTWHYSIPLLLLVLLAAFFGVLAMIYVNMRIPLLPMLQSVPAMIYQSMANLPVPFLARTDSQTGASTLPSRNLSQSSQPVQEPPSSSHTSENRVPLCIAEVKNECLTMREIAAFQQIAGQLSDVLMPALRDRAGFYQCGNASINYLSVAELVNLLEKDLQKVSDEGTSDGIVALSKLAELNSHWGLETVRGDDGVLLGISLASPPTYVLCHITAAIHYFFFLLVSLITVVLVCWLIYYCVSSYRQRKKLKSQQVIEMVEQILEVLGGLVSSGGNDYVVVDHVRDSLICPRERMTKKDVWKEAVLFIDNYESRIRREIMCVGEEDREVWRWTSGVPHSPSNSPGADGSSGRPPAKVWQGQAFESLETTHNLPNVSPTSCLKIRNMFDCDVEFGDSWPSRIQDSILEKCERISIVHVAVDRGSREGCVYLKCASLAEAGRAFRALHGWWYDGSLVTVKFLRDERYHQRFPIACHATRRLRPSNNKKLSLQVPVEQSDNVEHP